MKAERMSKRHHYHSSGNVLIDNQFNVTLRNDGDDGWIRLHIYASEVSMR
jgi:hypothetical protein